MASPATIALPAKAREVTASSPLRVFLIGAVAVNVLVAMARMWRCWMTDAWVDVPAAVMLSMSADLQHGWFYRPLFGQLGYGGTRYFPLYFVLHALLLKLGIPLLLGAYVLSAAAVVALLAGVYQLLRELRTPPWLAACAAGSLLASVSAQYAIASPHADGLAAALNVWGLAVIAQPNRKRRAITVASILFVLAWSAKMTTIFGLAAAIVWLVVQGARRSAWMLGVQTGCGYLLVAGAMIIASKGRVVEVFRACASGGAGWRQILAAPAAMIGVSRRVDPSLYLFLWLIVVLCILGMLNGLKRPALDLPTLLFGFTFLVTMMIFGSPGTNFNHLLDLQIACVVVIGIWITRQSSVQQRQLGIFALGLATLLCAQSPFHRMTTTIVDVEARRFSRTVEAIGAIDKPILAENAVVPLTAGQLPYVLDPWMVNLLGRRNPGFRQPLIDAVQQKRFGAIVLSMWDPQGDHGRKWYDQESFGTGFVPALFANYQLVATVDDQLIYKPKANAVIDSSRSTTSGARRNREGLSAAKKNAE